MELTEIEREIQLQKFLVEERRKEIDQTLNDNNAATKSIEEERQTKSTLNDNNAPAKPAKPATKTIEEEIPLIDLDKIEASDDVKEIIASLRDKLVASRKDIRENLARCQMLVGMYDLRSKQLSMSRKETDALIRETMDLGGNDIVVKKDLAALILQLLEERGKQHAEQSDVFKKFVFDALISAKKQIEDVYSSFGQEMNRPILEMKKYISDTRTVQDLLIPLVRLPNYRDRHISCNQGEVYLDLTRPEIPEAERNEKNIYDINNYEFGVNIKLDKDGKGFPNGRFTVTPEFTKHFQPTNLFFSVGSIDELVPAIDFCIANIETEIIKFLHEEQAAKEIDKPKSNNTPTITRKEIIEFLA